MPKVYRRADDDARQLLLEMLEKYHGELSAIKTTIDLVFVLPPLDEDGMPTGPALSLHGWPALATVKISSPVERALGLADARISLDEYQWFQMPEDERAAVLDHELEHLTPKLKDGEAQIDSTGRPVLKIRKHNYQFGWFRDVAQRHGRASQEVIQATRIHLNDGQLFFTFGAVESATIDALAGDKPEPKEESQCQPT